MPRDIEKPHYVGKQTQHFPEMNSSDIKQLNEEQIEKQRVAAQIAASALKEALEFVKEGVTCEEID